MCTALDGLETKLYTEKKILVFIKIDMYVQN
jgi:hypothetical protein